MHSVHGYTSLRVITSGFFSPHARICLWLASADPLLLAGGPSLAITTRQPTSIDPRPTLAGLDTFLSHPQAQPSDHRLGTLLKIACATRQAGDDSNDLSFKAVTPDSVQAFNIAVAAIER